MGISHLFEPDNFVLMKMRFGNYGELKAPVRWLTIAFTMGGEYLVIGWSTWMLLSLRPSRQRNAVLAMFAFGVGTHIFTVVHSRHRLVLELVLLLAAGGRYKPRDARRAWLAVGLVALIITIGLLSPGRAQLIDAITGVLSVRG